MQEWHHNANETISFGVKCSYCSKNSTFHHIERTFNCSVVPTWRARRDKVWYWAPSICNVSPGLTGLFASKAPKFYIRHLPSVTVLSHREQFDSLELTGIFASNSSKFDLRHFPSVMILGLFCFTQNFCIPTCQLIHDEVIMDEKPGLSGCINTVHDNLNGTRWWYHACSIEIMYARHIVWTPFFVG